MPDLFLVADLRLPFRVLPFGAQVKGLGSCAGRSSCEHAYC